MPKWARLENNIVLEITDIDPTDRYHSSLIWVPCPEDTSEYATYDPETNTFTPFVPEETSPLSEEPPSEEEGEMELQALRMSRLVNIERDRRIDAGFVFNGVRFQSKASDRENILGAAFMAMADPTFSTNWIAEDNSIIQMDASTIIAFARAAAEHKAHLIFAARSIKDMRPVPENFTDDSWWE